MSRSRVAVALAFALSGPTAHGGAPAGAWVPTLPLYAADVDVFDNGRAYALQPAQGLRDNPLPAAMWTSDDSGRTWSSTTLSFFPVTADMATPDRGYAVEFPSGTAAPAFYRTVDGAATWQRLRYPFPATAVGFDRTVPKLRTSPDGRTVFAGVSPLFRDREGCVVSPRETPYFLSNDGGQTWTSRALPPEGRIEDVEFRSADHGVLVVTEMRRGTIYTPAGCTSFGGDHLARSIWVTRDGGRTFAKTFSCVPVDCGNWGTIGLTSTGRLVRAPQDVWAETLDLAVEVSDDDGRTWRKTSALPCPTLFCAISDIDFADANVGYVTSTGIDGESGAIWRTADGGETWQVEHALGARLVAASPNGSGLAATQRAVLTRLTPGSAAGS